MPNSNKLKVTPNATGRPWKSEFYVYS